MSLMAVLVVGYIAYTRIPLGLLPEGLEGQWIHVSIPYRNAGPVEVEQKITRPLEEALATVPRIDQMRSSSYSSNANAHLRFRPHTNMKEAYAQVRDRMDRLMTLGIQAGGMIRLQQNHPAVVVQVGETSVALDKEICNEIYVLPLEK